MKKILLVYDVSYPHVKGGGQRRMYEIATRLVNKGFSVDWLCFKTWEGDNRILSNNINYIGLPGFKGLYRIDGSRRILEPLEFTHAILFSKINYDKYDFIWSGQWPMLHILLWVLWPKILGSAKLAIDWWEIWGETWFNYSKIFGRVGFFLEKFILKKASKLGHLILISPIGYEQAKLMAPKGNLTLIHNGIDLKAIQNAELEQGKDKFDFVYFGRLKNHKNVDLLLRAMHHLKVSQNLITTAIIIGGGPELINLTKLSEELNIAKEVTFLGPIEDNNTVYKFLKRCKLFVNPSTKEGGGSITLFEALGAGLPVVAFKCKDGIDSLLIGDGKYGKLVLSVSYEALADELFNLVSEPEKLSYMQRDALAVSANYDWDEIGNDYLNLFSQMQNECIESASCKI